MQMYMINQGKLEEINKPVFSTGDSYLVIDKETQKVYIWLGGKCSVDEKATAAMEAKKVDDEQFNGNAKIITYDQGMEDKEFLVKMDGLKIVEKNIAKTMLKDVKTGEFAGQMDWVDVLYRVSSEEFENMDAIKFLQVPFKKESLDSEDCFIMDIGTDIFVWQGSKSNAKEKAKAGAFARKFDAERAGAQTPKVFDEGEDAEFLAVFEGKRPKQDRETVDLKPEVYDEPAPAAAPEPIPVPKPEIKRTPVPQPKPEPVYTPNPEPEPEPEPDTAASGEVMLLKGGRIACPKCGNVNRAMIREIEDRTHRIMDYPLIYGKKFICGKCNAQFRKEE